MIAGRRPQPQGPDSAALQLRSAGDITSIMSRDPSGVTVNTRPSSNWIHSVANRSAPALPSSRRTLYLISSPTSASDSGTG